MKTALLLFAATALFAGTVNYTYDAAGRLTKVDYGAAGSIQYVYDKAGNLLKRTTTGPVAAPASDAPQSKPANPKQHPSPATNSNDKN